VLAVQELERPACGTISKKVNSSAWQEPQSAA
jgi:hypothetical protein